MMKIIDTVKEIKRTGYECEFCHKIFNESWVAETCEKKHRCETNNHKTSVISIHIDLNDTSDIGYTCECGKIDKMYDLPKNLIPIAMELLTKTLDQVKELNKDLTEK